MLPQRKRLRIEDFDYSDPNYVFFATLCARQHKNPFHNEQLARAVIDAINFSRNDGRWNIYSYCLMPDHLHLGLSPGPSQWSLPAAFRAFKRWTTRCGWGAGLHGKLWQRSWYDHVAREEEDLLDIVEYMLPNPVRGGLVEKPEDWLYSGMPDSLPR